MDINLDSVPYGPEDFDDVDEAILDVLTEGREEDEPWGIATPKVVHEKLAERGFEQLPARTTINSRMGRLADGDFLENLYDSGEYKLLEDPREDE